MASWTDMLLNVLKLTDQVKHMNRDIERVETKMTSINERVIRIETRLDTYVEVSKLTQGG
jgi:hypothetical protein